MTPTYRTEREVAERLGISRQTLQRWRRLTASGCPTGPKATRLGPRRIAYAETDLSAWLTDSARQAA